MNIESVLKGSPAGKTVSEIYGYSDPSGKVVRLLVNEPIRHTILNRLSINSYLSEPNKGKPVWVANGLHCISDDLHSIYTNYVEVIEHMCNELPCMVLFALGSPLKNDEPVVREIIRLCEFNNIPVYDALVEDVPCIHHDTLWDLRVPAYVENSAQKQIEAALDVTVEQSYLLSEYIMGVKTNQHKTLVSGLRNLLRGTHVTTDKTLNIVKLLVATQGLYQEHGDLSEVLSVYLQDETLKLDPLVFRGAYSWVVPTTNRRQVIRDIKLLYSLLTIDVRIRKDQGNSVEMLGSDWKARLEEPEGMRTKAMRELLYCVHATAAKTLAEYLYNKPEGSANKREGIKIKLGEPADKNSKLSKHPVLDAKHPGLLLMGALYNIRPMLASILYNLITDETIGEFKLSVFGDCFNSPTRPIKNKPNTVLVKQTCSLPQLYDQLYLLKVEVESRLSLLKQYNKCDIHSYNAAVEAGTIQNETTRPRHVVFIEDLALLLSSTQDGIRALSLFQSIFADAGKAGVYFVAGTSATVDMTSFQCFRKRLDILTVKEVSGKIVADCESSSFKQNSCWWELTDTKQCDWLKELNKFK